MDNLTMWAGIVGFLSPPVIAIINQPKFDARLKVVIMVGFSLLAGFLTAYFSNMLDGEDIVKSILVTMTATIVAYQGIFKPTNIADKITWKTSNERKLYSDDQAG